MIKLIKKLLGLCIHEYKTIEVATNVIHNRGKSIPVGNIYFQECKKCRKIRKYAV